MSKIISIAVLGFLTFTGIKTLIRHFDKPNFVEMTIDELDATDSKDLKFVKISDGWSMGSYIYEERSNVVKSIKYPIINMNNSISELDTSKLRTKLIVYDYKADSVGFGPQLVEGKVMPTTLTAEEKELMIDGFDLDPNYIIVSNNWSKPSLTLGLLLTIIPGLLLLANISIFFRGRPNKSTEMV